MGVTEVAFSVVGAGLSLLAGSIGRPNQESHVPLKDEKPSPRSTKGTRAPLILGARRVAPIIAWCGDRDTETETVAAPGGKGGGGGGAAGKVTTYFESSIHVLAVGPMWELRRIWQNGKVIFNSPVTQESDPGGATVDLGDQGSFTIYWGEDDQPKSPYVKDHLKIDSRFPYICYLVWRKKKLGKGGWRWPNLEYEIVSRPYDTGLFASNPFLDEVEQFDPDKQFAITGFLNGEPGDCYVEIAGKKKEHFKPDDEVYIQGNAHQPDEFLTVSKVQYLKGTNKTRIYFDEDLDDLDSTGSVFAQAKKDTNGVNLAHALYQLMFAPFPHGAGLDPDEFDINSLEALGELLDQGKEELPGSIAAYDGDEARTIIAELLQDLGVFISFDPSTGLYRFVPIRTPEAPIPHLSSEVILPARPEIETDLDERPSNVLQFEYPDRQRKFRKETITISDDGQAALNGKKRPRVIQLNSCVDVIAAMKIAQRRAQEELATGAVVRIRSNREARRMFPGISFTAEGIKFTMRLTDIKPDAYSGRCDLTALDDYYGVPASSFVLTDPLGEDDGAGGESSEENYDAQFDVVEAPPPVGPPGITAVVIPRIRSTVLTTEAETWLSFDDGATYTFAATNLYRAAGGTLVDGLPADTLTVLEEGPEFNVLGPDIAKVLDLTGKEKDWLTGQQVALIVSSAGAEWCFLRAVTATDDTVYRLDGLMRARLGTDKLEHPAGARLYIFPWDGVLVLQNPAFTLGAEVMVKSKPSAGGGGAGYPLDEVDPVSTTLTGIYTSVPAPPNNLTVPPFLGNPRLFFNSGDLDVTWGWRALDKAKTSAGQQKAGQPVADTQLEGTFTVELRETDDTSVAVFDGITEPRKYFAWADLLTAFAGDVPSAFKIVVTHTVAGMTSGEVEITVTEFT